MHIVGIAQNYQNIYIMGIISKNGKKNLADLL